MTTLSGFDVRQIDIYDEEGFGPPPRFLVEPERRDQRQHDDSDDEPYDLASLLIDKVKAVLNALRG